MQDDYELCKKYDNLVIDKEQLVVLEHEKQE